jgi:hypothetical protein
MIKTIFNTFLQYSIIILVTAIQYLLIQTNLNKFLLFLLILCFSLAKVIYFSILIFKKLSDIAKDIKYLNFLAFTAFNIFFLVFSFSIDYFLIYQLDKLSFSGMEGTSNIYEVYFKLFYLSFLLFTNMGVANVIPVTIPAECVVMFEAIASFSTVIFILSDFVTLKDSLQKLRKPKP